MDQDMIQQNSLDALFDPTRNNVPAICVEMSGNHQGSEQAAIHFARAAKDAGADLLKLQVYRPDTITIKSDREDFRLSKDNDWAEYGTLYSLYEQAHTPWDWIRTIFSEANRIELPVWASPFDPSAVDLLEELNCPYYKIASPEITDLGLIEACARTGKPIVMSTGLASVTDLDDAVEVVRDYGSPLMILKCVSAYPTPVEDMNVATIPWLRAKYGCAVGLSDHTLGPEAAYAATALGAAMIEKHFRLPDDNSSVDAGFSMSLDQLPALKASLSAVHSAIGKATMELPDIAKPSLSGRRSLYIIKNMKAGEVITNDNVRSIRPCFGMPPKYLPKILGRKVNRDILAGERMTWDLIDGGEKIQ
jgi:pseudaminic acid synthase